MEDSFVERDSVSEDVTTSGGPTITLISDEGATTHEHEHDHRHENDSTSSDSDPLTIHQENESKLNNNKYDNYKSKKLKKEKTVNIILIDACASI